MRIAQNTHHLDLASMVLSDDPETRRRAMGIYLEVHTSGFRKKALREGVAIPPAFDAEGTFLKAYHLFERRLGALTGQGLPLAAAERDARELSHVFLNAAVAAHGLDPLIETALMERASVEDEVRHAWDRLVQSAAGRLPFRFEGGRLTPDPGGSEPGRPSP